MPKPEKLQAKKAVVDEIASAISGNASVVLVDPRGLTVAQDTRLRKSLREAGVTYKVYKNTMMHRAFEGTVEAALDQYLEGPSAIAISKDDATAPARLLVEFSKKEKIELPAIKAGTVEGTVYDAAGITAIAAIPARETLLGRLFGSMQSPITNLARVLNQIAESKSEPQQSAAPQEAPTEAPQEAPQEAPSEA